MHTLPQPFAETEIPSGVNIVQPLHANRGRGRPRNRLVEEAGRQFGGKGAIPALDLEHLLRDGRAAGAAHAGRRFGEGRPPPAADRALRV